MDDKSHIGFINSHPEGNRRDNDLALIANEGFLVSLTVSVFHSRMIRKCFDPKFLYGIDLLAEDAEGNRASLVSGFSYNVADEKPFRIVLQRKQKTKVTVVDADNEPLPDSIVRIFANYHEIGEATTDNIASFDCFARC